MNNLNILMYLGQNIPDVLQFVCFFRLSSGRSLVNLVYDLVRSDNGDDLDEPPRPDVSPSCVLLHHHLRWAIFCRCAWI